jgi:hypothetical protein
MIKAISWAALAVSIQLCCMVVDILIVSSLFMLPILAIKYYGVVRGTVCAMIIIAVASYPISQTGGLMVSFRPKQFKSLFKCITNRQ